MPTLILGGSKEFKQHVKIFERIDEMLRVDGVENHLKTILIQRIIDSSKSYIDLTDQLKIQKDISRSLRTNIAHSVCGESFKKFAIRLADSNTLQWFCGYDDPIIKKIPGKSKLHTLSKLIPIDILLETSDYIMSKFGKSSSSLTEKIDLSSLYVDSTCVNLNVHHPIDWILLKDAVKTIVKSIKCLRSHGLKHRISPPDGFIKQANRIVMDMTLSRSHRRNESKKKRKRLFRELKTLLRTVSGHGVRYVSLLHKEQKTCTLSVAQAEQISNRMINVLDQVDDIIFQANERIIGERKVVNKTKILSLYEKHTQVYKRGKAGADVEFGLQLFVAETEQGLISNWILRKDAPQHDSKFIRPCIEALEKAGIKPDDLTGDRGFSAKSVESFLQNKNVKSNICPKNRKELKKKLKSKKFKSAANRRSQTEGRIGILKNNFIGGVLKSKGFENQELQVAWSIITHNLWVLTRLDAKEQPKYLVA